MAAGAVLLSQAALAFDRGGGLDFNDALGLAGGLNPDGARQMLAVIAASMITAGTTVFSVTIAAVAFAAGQYGPRLLTNFLANRGNQITLGTFIATFLYAMLVMRTVRTAEAAGGGFVPEAAVLIAMLLALFAIAVLIFFLHHAPNAIRINRVIATIGRQILDDMDERFPNTLARPMEQAAAEAAIEASARLAAVTPLLAKSTGYIEIIDGGTLAEAAAEANAVVRLRTRPGAFVHPGTLIAEIQAPEPPGEDGLADIAGAFAIGPQRTPAQDLDFLLDELVEIALRALSPGINDPFTAIACLDFLSAAISKLATLETPSAGRADADGTLRIIAPVRSYDSYVLRTFGTIRQASATNVKAAAGHFRALAAAVCGCGEDSGKIALLRAEGDRLLAQIKESLTGPDLVMATAAHNAFLVAVSTVPPALDAFDEPAAID